MKKLLFFLITVNVWGLSPVGYLDLAPQVVSALFNSGAGGGEPTFTFIQGKQGTKISSCAANPCVTVTLTSAPTAGANPNAVVCMVQIFGTTPTTVSDGNSNAFTHTAHSPSNASGSSVPVDLYYRFYVNGDTPSATINGNVTTPGSISFTSEIQCSEFHRSAGSWSLDTTYDVVGSSTSSVTAINTPNLAPSVTGELQYCGVYGAGGVTGVNNGGGFSWIAGPAFSNGQAQADAYLLGGGTSTRIDMVQASQQYNSLCMWVK